MKHKATKVLFCAHCSATQKKHVNCFCIIFNLPWSWQRFDFASFEHDV